TKSLWLFIIQLAFNFSWSIIFFNFQAFSAAFFWLLALIALALMMTLSFRKVDMLAAILQIPYLLWLTFAGYLNFNVWMLN
ncbi:MAG: tryptophan-rich sensory protein, partial [Synergistaceae bacterium]|nr:tryptophan-rich sensory protein [Synergistaceae bacterium]